VKNNRKKTTVFSIVGLRYIIKPVTV